MPKPLVAFLLLLIVLGLGYGAFQFVQRYGRTGAQVEKMVTVMSEVQTARVKLRLDRFPVEGESRFLFGDIDAAGVVDLRPAGGAYDLSLDVAAVPGVSEERARVGVRRVNGRTFVRLREAPAALSELLARFGVSLEGWTPVTDSSQVLKLLGETASMPPVFTEHPLAVIRENARATTWFVEPKATLTEIVHGKVTRLITAELNPDALAFFLGVKPHVEWEGARVNMWIDQSSSELRRIIVQLTNGTQIDVEFEEINGEVEILSTEALPEPLEKLGTEGEDIGVVRTNDVVQTPASNDRDGDGLTDDLEGFYRSDADNPDTDGDGYSDGEEVQNGYSPTGPSTLFNFGLPTL